MEDGVSTSVVEMEWGIALLTESRNFFVATNPARKVLVRSVRGRDTEYLETWGLAPPEPTYVIYFSSDCS